MIFRRLRSGKARGLSGMGDALITRPLWAHQKDGVKWLYTHRRGLLRHGTGSGKTLTVLAALALAEMRGERVKALVLCDNSSLVSFMEDLQTKTRLSYRRIKVPSDCRLNSVVHLLAYSQLHKAMPEILGQDAYTHLILDEAHKVKSGTSRVGKDAREISVCFKNVWLLTATPLLNDLEDVYFLLSYLSPNILGTLDNFKNRFCILEEKQINAWMRNFFTKRMERVTRTVYETVGYKNLSELKALLDEYSHSYYREYDIRFKEYRFRLTREEEAAYIEAAKV